MSSDDMKKTKAQLVEELLELRSKLAKSERALAGDMTESRESAKALEESETRLRAAIENLPFDFFLLSKDGTYSMLNSLCKEHYGDIVGKRPEDVAPDRETFAIWLDNNRRAFNGEVIREEVEFPVKGELKSYFNIIAPVQHGGEVSEIMGMNVDVTEMKRAQEKLRKSEERYRHLLESISEAVFAVDFEWRYILINQYCADMVQIPRENFFGATLMDLFPGYEDTVFFKAYKRVMESRKPESIEAEHVFPDGRKGFYEGKIYPIDEGILCIASDVTERRKIEQDLQRAQKLESIGVLAGGIAHDFNNILTGVFGGIQLAKMDCEPGSRAHEILTEAEKSSARATDLTRQLLTFARGGAPVKQAACIEEIIRESAGFALRGSNVRCEFSFPKDLRPVSVDVGQISQVINNLVINADQAMPGGGSLKIGAENLIVKEEGMYSLSPGNYVKIEVEDQGIGIEEKHLSKIFDPYFTTKKSGNGIGLAISYSIVKRHNGAIEVESELSKGSKFCVYLPASDEAELGSQKSEKKIVGGDGRILLVDDDETVRNVTARMLERLGYEAVTVADGADGVELYKNSLAAGEPFSTVILDLTIPGGMGGTATLNELLKIDPHCKAIVISGYSNDPVMADYEKYGFKGMAGKPLRIEELGELLKKVINS